MTGAPGFRLMELDLFPKLWIFLEGLEGCRHSTEASRDRTIKNIFLRPSCRPRLILLALRCYLLQGQRSRRANLVSTRVTHSSCRAAGVGGAVRAARRVGGLAHGAQRPLLLFIRRRFGDGSESKGEMRQAYEGTIAEICIQ